MPKFTPVDHDPFAPASIGSEPKFTPVDHDPFAGAGPVDAASDIGRMVIKGAFMGQEASPDDAIARDAAMRAVGKKFARGRVNQENRLPAMEPEEYRKFYSDQSAKQKLAAERAGWAGTVAEVGGMMLPGSVVAKGVGGGLALASKIPLMGRLGSSAATSVGTGAAMGAMSNPKDRIEGALFGAGAGILGHGVGKAIGAGVNKVASYLPRYAPEIPASKIPDAAAINAARDAAYKAADDAGVIFKPEFVQSVRDKIIPEITEKAFDPAAQKPFATALKRFSQAGNEHQTLKNIDILRRHFSNAWDAGNKPNNSMARTAINAIDDKIMSPGSTVSAGNAKEGAKAIIAARENAHKLFKIEDVAKAMERADLTAAATHSGQNVQNNIRRSLKDMLLNPNRIRGFTEDEKKLMESIVRGSPTGNALRSVSKFMPNLGIGGMASAAVAHSIGGPAAAIGQNLGSSAIRAGADKSTKMGVEQLDRLIRAGGDLSKILPKEALTKVERNAIIQALIGAGVVSTTPNRQ